MPQNPREPNDTNHLRQPRAEPVKLRQARHGALADCCRGERVERARKEQKAERSRAERDGEKCAVKKHTCISTLSLSRSLALAPACRRARAINTRRRALPTRNSPPAKYPLLGAHGAHEELNRLLARVRGSSAGATLPPVKYLSRLTLNRPPRGATVRQIILFAIHSIRPRVHGIFSFGVSLPADGTHCATNMEQLGSWTTVYLFMVVWATLPHRKSRSRLSLASLSSASCARLGPLLRPGAARRATSVIRG